MASKLADRAPRVVEKDDGTQVWVYDGEEIPNVGFNAVVGRPVSEYSFEPARFDEMRRGAWDIHERIRDMDLNGIYASLCFPSFLPGFAGQRIQVGPRSRARAGHGAGLERLAHRRVGRVVPGPHHPVPAARTSSIPRSRPRRSAATPARGFKAVTFSEMPHELGLPSLHSGHWDPLMRACAETGTVVNLHIGSSSTSPSTSDDAPPDVIGVLFFGYAMFSAVDWLYSRIPVRFPDIRICLSEGGIGWVPALLDRLDHMLRYHEMYGTWSGIELTPAEVMQRNFWFSAVEDPSAFAMRERIGVDKILLEADYPHCDSTWPDTQAVIEREIGGLPPDDIRRITWATRRTSTGTPCPPKCRPTRRVLSMP